MNIDSVSPAATVSAAHSTAAPVAPGADSAPVAPPVVPAPVTPTAAASPADELRKSVEAIRQWLPEPVRTDLKFRIEDGQVVVSVVDSKSGDVVRQIPADVVIRVARNLQQFIGGFVHEVA